ncbi:predicted protein [Nematostella vectensis]|uniref:C2 domain-containing protein n=1 Tax=Nematostella vectensis TaxID=45351 RepID=A7RWL8_NEMVE|nr:predicted protein [Nematostella vectensis]|eukprot:XP_001636209.1 predicted protein [Nematostella vectensis]
MGDTALRNIDFSKLSKQEARLLKRVLEKQRYFEELTDRRKTYLKLEIKQLEERLANAARYARDPLLCRISHRTKVSTTVMRHSQKCQRQTYPDLPNEPQQAEPEEGRREEGGMEGEGREDGGMEEGGRKEEAINDNERENDEDEALMYRLEVFQSDKYSLSGTLEICQREGADASCERQSQRQRKSTSLHMERGRPLIERVTLANPNQGPYIEGEDFQRTSVFDQLQATESLDIMDSDSNRLPATPELSLWYESHGQNLVIGVLQAIGLPLGVIAGEEIPNPYAIITLLPERRITNQFRTPVHYTTTSPKWNLSFIYSDFTPEEFSTRQLEVVLWNERKTYSHALLRKTKSGSEEKLRDVGLARQWRDTGQKHFYLSAYV